MEPLATKKAAREVAVGKEATFAAVHVTEKAAAPMDADGKAEGKVKVSHSNNGREKWNKKKNRVQANKKRMIDPQETRRNLKKEIRCLRKFEATTGTLLVHHAASQLHCLCRTYWWQLIILMPRPRKHWV